MVNPCAAAAVPKGIARHRDVGATFFHADDATTVCSVNEVSGDGGITTIFCEEEGAHSAADDVVIRKYHVLRALDVHGVAECAELASGDAHIACGHNIKRAFSGAAPPGGIGSEVMGKHVARDAGATGTTAPDGRTVWRVGDADEVGSGVCDKVLPTAHEIGRQVGSEEGDGVRWRVGCAALEMAFDVIDENAV